MPSIIGSSTIAGITVSFTGPTGFTGPIGPRGPIGPVGLTLGPTGPTGFYVKNVISDLNQNRIRFELSDNRIIGPFSGFTGPNVVLKQSIGVSAAFSTDYLNLLMGVCSGQTFQFRGICGDGSVVFPRLSADGTELIVSIETITGGVSLGNTASNFLMYSTPLGRVSATKIRVDESVAHHKEEESSQFLTQLPGDHLNLGLTAPGQSVPNVSVFSDFTETFISVSSIPRNVQPALPIAGISGIDQGGYVVDLDKSSVFKFATPLGITAFYRNQKYSKNWSELADSATIDSWVFFIEGSDVWNLPSNLLFDSGITGGIGNFAFCKGMNILRVQSDYKRGVYYATFIDRCFGESSDVLQYGGIGSCCYSGGCDDYVTEEYCDTKSGTFAALKTCKESCNIGSCCLNGVCKDNVSKQVCEHYLGEWNTFACPSGDGTPCTPGNKFHLLTKINTTEPVALPDTATRSNLTKVGEFRVTTNDSPITISVPTVLMEDESIGMFSFIGTQTGFASDHSGGFATISSATPLIGATFAVYFSNEFSIEDKPYKTYNLPLTLKDNTNTVKATLNYIVRPTFTESCGGDPNSVRIRTVFDLSRYCVDCYETPASGGFQKYFPVQKQQGTFDYCYNKVTGTRVPICASSTAVEHINSCTFTDAMLSEPEDPLLPCTHLEHDFIANQRGYTYAPCFNAEENGCVCNDGTGEDKGCCCGDCFRPEMDPASPNYGRCVYSPACNTTLCNGLVNAAGVPLTPGDPEPRAEVCIGGPINGGRDGTVVRRTNEGSGQTTTSRGSKDVEFTDAQGNTFKPDPYWYGPSFYPNDEALRTQLYYAGITSTSGISAEFNWITSQIESMINPDNGSFLYFTPVNQNKNISLTPALGLTCCNYGDYDQSNKQSPNELIPLDWTPPTQTPEEGEYEIRYFLLAGVGASEMDQRCWSINATFYWMGQKIPVQPSCTATCSQRYGHRRENLFIKCTVKKGTTDLSLIHRPCVLKSLKYSSECISTGWVGLASAGCAQGSYRYEVSWPTESNVPSVAELLPQNATRINGISYAQITRFRNVCNPEANVNDPSTFSKPPCNTIPACDISGFMNDLLTEQSDGLHPLSKWWLSTRGINACAAGARTARVDCSQEVMANLLPATMTLQQKLLLQASMEELVWKPRYCPCNPTTSSPVSCSSEDCLFLGQLCAPNAALNLGIPTNFSFPNCELVELPGAKKYIFSIIQDPDATGDATIFEPRLYEIDLLTNTVTLTNYWLYYSTGRINVLPDNTPLIDSQIISSNSPGSGLPANLQKIRSGQRFTVPFIDQNPLGLVYAYWDGLNGFNDDFFNRQNYIKMIARVDPTVYVDGDGEELVYDNIPGGSPDTVIKITPTDSETFNVELNIEPSVFLSPMTNGGWAIRAVSYNLWTVVDPPLTAQTPITLTATVDNFGNVSPDQNFDIDYTSVFGPFKYNEFPVNEYSDDKWIRFQVVTTVIVNKDIKTQINPSTGEAEGDGFTDYRVLEKVSNFKILRPGAVIPANLVAPTAKSKLLTVNGASQCVEIDCQSSDDCFNLQDC